MRSVKRGVAWLLAFLTIQVSISVMLKTAAAYPQWRRRWTPISGRGWPWGSPISCRIPPSFWSLGRGRLQRRSPAPWSRRWGCCSWQRDPQLKDRA